MPKIRIPETVSVVANSGTGELLDPPYEFVAHFLLNGYGAQAGRLSDPQLGASVQSLYLGWETRDAFKSAKPGDVVDLTQEQYAILLRVTETPSAPYHVPLLMQCRAYVEAITKPEAK